MPQHPPAEVDPVFSAVAKAIYGDDVDPREVLAKSGGAAAPTGNPERDKRVAQTGLAATGVATAGVGHALTASWNEHKHRTAAAQGKTYTPKPLSPRRAKLKVVRQAAARKVGLTPTRAALAAGVGYGALHGVEAVSDGLAIHAQTKALKNANAQLADKKRVSKGLRLRPLNAIVDRTPSLRAKRPKLTPTVGSPRTRNGIYQPVGKGFATSATRALKGVRHAADGVGSVVGHVKTVTGDAARTTSAVADTAGKVKRLVPTPRTAALMAGGSLTALTGATYAGTRAGTYAGTRPARPKKKAVAKMLAPAGQLPQPHDEYDVTWTGTITKVDADQRLVFGWASVSKLNGEDVVDLQGDIVPIDEIEKSAYKYVIESRVGGDMHRRVSKLDDGTKAHHTADLVESMVFTPEKLEKMGLPADALPHGWWVGYKVQDDAQWALVKSGARAGFSIHGSGKRTPVSKSADGPKLRERVRQAVHPPAVRVKDVKSAAIEAMGYQPQTRRLAVVMRSRPGQPYDYRMGPGAARDALEAPSKGHHYATQVRGRAKRANHVTVADRARLFANPDVAKSLRPIGKVPTA